MIIPPQLLILAGFKPDDLTITIEMVIAALQKMKLRQSATSISNEKKSGLAGKRAADADVRERAAKFRLLMNEREQRLPNEPYESRFSEVVSSDEGQQLFAQMERPEIFGNQFSDQEGTGSDKARPGASGAVSDQDVIGSDKARPAAAGAAKYDSKEEARDAFLAEVKKLQDAGINYEYAYNTAAQTEPGRSAWEFWKIAAEQEKKLPVIIRTPPELPAAAQTKFRGYNA